MRPIFSLLLWGLFFGIIISCLFAAYVRLSVVIPFYRHQKDQRNLLISLLGTRMDQKLDLATVKNIKEDTLESDIHRRQVIFSSSFDETIPCYLFFRENRGKKPAILVASGHGNGIIETGGLVESEQNGDALALAQQGYVTLTCENRGQGLLVYYPRTSERKSVRAVDPANNDDWYQLVHQEKDKLLPQEEVPSLVGFPSYMGLILEDQRRALDYLESLPFVDRKRIGVAGVSMGGEISLYLAAIDPRVKSAIIMGWLTSWEELGDDMPDWKIPNIETNFPTMAEIGMLIAPRFALYHTGMSDPLFSEQLSQGIFFGIKNYYQKLGVENRVRFESRGVGHAFVNDLAISFFKETLNQYTSTSNLELLF